MALKSPSSQRIHYYLTRMRRKGGDSLHFPEQTHWCIILENDFSLFYWRSTRKGNMSAGKSDCPVGYQILKSWLTVWPTTRMNDHLSDWLTDSPTDWPADRLNDRLRDWLTDRPIDRPTDLLTASLTDWPPDRRTDWLTDWLVHWQFNHFMVSESLPCRIHQIIYTRTVLHLQFLILNFSVCSLCEWPEGG
jgi:hypothetical protein